MTLNINKRLQLVLWIIFFESIGFFLGLLTQANIAPWYAHLHKSLLTPPGVIFSIVWSLLYALLAVIAWILSTHHSRPSNKIFFLFTLQMIMNWVWTPLFFGLHWLMPSAFWLIGLTSLNVFLIIEAKKTHRIIAGLLTPYLIWLMFATYLNVIIAIMN